jgi:hypothetical protein
MTELSDEWLRDESWLRDQPYDHRRETVIREVTADEAGELRLRDLYDRAFQDGRRAG